MVTLLLSTDPELLWGSEMEELLPPAQWPLTVYSRVCFHLLSNVHKFVRIHCPSSDFFTVGVYYKFVFYTVTPMGYFGGMEVDMYVHPAILN